MRVSFAVPWAGSLLLGTTDEPYDADPGRVEPTDADVRQVVAEASLAVRAEVVAPEKVHYAFAALRVLPGVAGDTTRARRESVIDVGPAGMVSVAGGKLTTYRRIALDVLAKLESTLGLHRLDRRPWPLPGAVGIQVDRAHRPGSRRASARTCSTSTARSPPRCSHRPRRTRRCSSPVAEGAPDLAAQVLYAATHEWARSEDDVLRRRTLLTIGGHTNARVEARVAELLGSSAARPAAVDRR